MVSLDQLFDRLDEMARNKNIRTGLIISLESETTATGKKASAKIDMTPDEYKQIGPEAVQQTIEQLEQLTGGSSHETQLDEEEDSSPTLSEILDEFIRSHNWKTPKTETAYRATMTIFMALVGNKPIAKVDKSDARLFRGAVIRLPRDIRQQNSPFKDMSLDEILSMHHDETISPTTVHHHIGRMSAIFGWLKNNYDEVTTNSFKEMNVKRPKSIERSFSDSG